MKPLLFLLSLSLGILVAQTPLISTQPPASGFKIFENDVARKLPDTVLVDSFGLTARGSLALKKDLPSLGKENEPEITLTDVTQGLKLYGLFPNTEAIVNSLLWKIHSRLIVRFKNRDYVLILKEVTEEGITIGWLENEKLQTIAFHTPSYSGIAEQTEPPQTENPESMLVLDLPPTLPLNKTMDKKR